MLGSKPTRRYCRYCGSSVTPTDAFCSSCGERLVPREGIARDNRAATVPSRAETRHASFSRFWPASAGREIVAGVLVAVSVAVLLVGLIYGLLMLRGAFADPSVPRTLGLVVFSLVHGGAFSVSVPPSPSLLGIGGLSYSVFRRPRSRCSRSLPCWCSVDSSRAVPRARSSSPALPPSPTRSSSACSPPSAPFL